MWEIFEEMASMVDELEQEFNELKEKIGKA